MTEPASKVSVKAEENPAQRQAAPSAWRPFESLRREVDRLFDDFDRSSWRLPFRRSAFDIEPLWRRELGWGTAPAVDIVEKDNAYEITAELPGMDEKNIELKITDGNLVIKGEKQEQKEEKKKGGGITFLQQILFFS